MKHRELQDYYLNRMFGQDFDEAERVIARQEVDAVINDILGFHDNWPFVHKQADFVVPAGVNAIALPHDFISCESIFVDDREVDILHPSDFMKAVNIENRTSVVSIFFNEMTPYASLGNVFPVYGSNQVQGIGTQFDGTLVGKFFQSGRDGELYQVDHVTSPTALVLKSCFVGRSQIGRLKVFPDNLLMVVGDPSLNRWSKDLEGRLIKMENNSLSRRIVEVNESEQVMKLNSVCDSDGENIIYSIEDTFAVDPAGNYILNLWESDENGEDRQVNISYRRAATHLSSDKDNPVIPFNWHHVIQKGLDCRISINDEASSSRIQLLQMIFSEAKSEMKSRCIVEFPAAQGAMEAEDDPRDFG